ncbi:MAG: glycosyltransferase family 2 protein [Hyphomicrobiales bacterium]|nr:glycosyltransferase family 2 protein [Hyphomicrobiales bacterium]
MQLVTIAIASMGRSSLADTLRSLADLSATQGIVATALVADDSRDGAAQRIIESLDIDSLSITCIPVGAGNISHARNALLDATTGDWMVFVDDDEWVEPNWLERLFACQAEYRADVVIGPVLPAYPDNAPRWLVRANPLYLNWGYRGKRLSTGRGGNTLVRMELVRRLGLRFDPALGVSGGEDTAFFAEAAARGAVIVATDDAIVHERVPPERLQPSYILRRAVRSGQSYGNLRKAGNPGLVAQLVFAIDATAKCAAAALLALFYMPFDRASFFRMRQKLALNRGKLRAVFGLPLAQLYRQTD